jgi:hypothetical protein
LQKEVHGVAALAVEAMPELASSSLQALKEVIERLPPTYLFQQYSINHYYIQSDNFLLKFLRADLFNVPSTAKRLMSHGDSLFQYFGSYALRRPMKLSDLSNKEQSISRAGHFQIMSRDCSGRLIKYHSATMDFQGSSVKNLVVQRQKKSFTPGKSSHIKHLAI